LTEFVADHYKGRDISGVSQSFLIIFHIVKVFHLEVQVLALKARVLVFVFLFTIFNIYKGTHLLTLD